MKKKHLKLKKKNVFWILFFVLFFLSFFRLIFYFFDLLENQSFHKNLVKEVMKKEDVEENGEIKTVQTIDFEKLKQINEDTQGWISYHEDLIQYPVVRATNNSYYLNHALDRSKNTNGTIFMDYRNSSWNDKNVILYGHNSVNQTMFGSLIDVFEPNFFDVGEHHYIQIFTPNGSFVYQIFSYYIIEEEEYYITPSFSSEESFFTFLKDMEQRSFKKFDIELQSSDFVLTLSTCEGSGNTTKRKVIHAKRI